MVVGRLCWLSLDSVRVAMTVGRMVVVATGDDYYDVVAVVVVAYFGVDALQLMMMLLVAAASDGQVVAGDRSLNDALSVVAAVAVDFAAVDDLRDDCSDEMKGKEGWQNWLTMKSMGSDLYVPEQQEQVVSVSDFDEAVVAVVDYDDHVYYVATVCTKHQHSTTYAFVHDLLTMNEMLVKQRMPASSTNDWILSLVKCHSRWRND